MTTVNEQLTEVCREIAHQIRNARRAREVWAFIGEHAEAINKAKYGAFFGVTQRATIQETLLAVTRIYDGRNRTMPDARGNKAPVRRQF